MIPLLLFANMMANTAAHICLKLSAVSRKAVRFVFWQVLGNLGALGGVLAYTALLRTLTLHVTYPLTQGFTAVGVQFVASRLILGEKIAPVAWAGTTLILAGIVLVSM